ncbi:MAG: bacillithiol system redox-active protein YtxJ [Puia sp.]|nr:bacillithiol system redox-active protein YtxJ [Puia sp.]
MNWIPLNDPTQLEEIKTRSAGRPQVIFKHSTSCSISKMVLNRLERNEAPASLDFYFLDLLKYRPVSNQVAETFRITHQSPQVLLIRDGKCVYDESHTGISMDEILEVAS